MGTAAATAADPLLEDLLRACNEATPLFCLIFGQLARCGEAQCSHDAKSPGTVL